MASNYTHQARVEESLGEFNSSLSDNVTQQIQDIGQSDLLARKGSCQPCGSVLAGKDGIGFCHLRPINMTTNSGSTKFNDVQLIRHRHVKVDRSMRKQFELLCEDKVSRNKLEEVHNSLPSSIKSTFIMTFSPDGQRVASTHGDHRIYICDLNTGKLIDTLEGHPKTPWCLAWHPCNTDILASGCLAGEVRVWDLRSKACESWTSENNTIITSLDFHPIERILVIATANDILFWDWSASEPFAKTTTMHDREKVKYVVFDSSGTKLITGISNLPKFAGYSSDSLQTRIIDGYLSQGSIEPLPTDNMTQNSEVTTSSISAPIITNENIGGESDAASTARRAHNIGSHAPTVHVNEQDVCYRNTMLLSRVAYLYRQLESLEDSIRHTSFAPFMNYQQTTQPNAQADQNCQPSSSEKLIETTKSEEANDSSSDSMRNQAPSASLKLTSDTSGASQGSSVPTPNTFEPHLVTFDESLEQLQLPPLVIDGQAINLASVIDQYPVDLSNPLCHVMQFESISQVSQNFIRISKLMSSARLYRQVVQQIVANVSGNVPFQPNQVLTAQSVTPRSPRNSPNLPIVLRNFPISGNTLDSRSGRQHDPILAIEFRNSARNVPLPTICKIDLLAARAICVLRSQHLVEQALANAKPSLSSSEQESTSDNSGISSSRQNESSRVRASTVQSIIGQLHSTLTIINHAPLTTSNAYTHITTLRMLIDKLNKALSSMLGSVLEGRRLSDLMHKIAFSLTSRQWSVPLGATLNEIRLDVIHTLCIVDLTLHFTRQVQLLQMQRISLMTRIEESRRPTTAGSRVVAANSRQHQQRISDSSPGESSQSSLDAITSENLSNQPGTSTAGSKVTKRKSDPPSVDSNKRQRVETSRIEQLSVNSEDVPLVHDQNSVDQASENSQAADRMVIWNSPQNQIEQSLQRFFMATSSGMNNSHILVRFYHRMPNVAPSYPPTFPLNALLESALEHRTSPHAESRRRALSQDNVISSDETVEPSASGADATTARVRVSVRAPAPVHVNLVPTGSVSGANAPYEGWQRQPHLHVYQTRGSGPHLWFNQWTIPLPVNNLNYRLQCWNFSRSSIPNIQDAQLNVITHKCRIQNDSSIDVSSNGCVLACLVPEEDAPASGPRLELKIFSLKAHDFGVCYYKLPQGPCAVSVSLSPSGTYAVVGIASYKFSSYDQNDGNLTIGKVYKIPHKNSCEFVRDIKIKRDDSSLSLNAIKWMTRGIVYNVGPQHHQRYHAARMRNAAS